MKRAAIQKILQAALIAGLLSVWYVVLQERFPRLISFPFPGSHQFWQALFGEDILPSNDEGLLFDAWALGPLFLIINSLTWLPFTFAILHFVYKSKVHARVLGAGFLLAGLSSLVAGYWVSVPFLRYASSAGIPVGENYYLFFVFLPRVLLGSIAVIESYRISKTPQRE